MTIGIAVHGPGAARAARAGLEVAEAVGSEWQQPAWEGSPERRGDLAKADGTIIGWVISEAYCILRDGVVIGTRGSDTISWAGRERD